MKKKVKIILCAVLAAVVLITAVVLVGNLVGPKKIKVGVMVDEPMAYKDIDGEWTGFDVDFAKEMFSNLNYVPEFTPVTASTRDQMLKKGEIDCYMSGTDNSVGEFIHSEDYVSSIQVVFHKNIEGIEVNSFSDLGRYRVGVLNGSKNATTVKQYAQEVNILEHATNEEIIEMLDIYDIEVALMDYMYVENLVQGNSKYSSDIIGIIYDYSDHFIVFNKKNSKLCEKVNGLIESYKEQGYFNAWKSAYSMGDYYQ